MSAMIETMYLTTRPNLMRWYEAVSSSSGRCLAPVWAVKADCHGSVLARINALIDNNPDPEILNAIKAAVAAEAWDIVEMLIEPAC